MWKTKDDIWFKFGQSYKQGDAKSSYCKCSTCDERVIVTAGHMCDHWAKCKKCPGAISQLYESFQPSQKSAKTWTMQSSSTHSSVGNGGSTIGELVEPLNPLPFFTGGRQHFDSLKKGELEKLHQLFAKRLKRSP
jgi:hypothetical protein